MILCGQFSAMHPALVTKLVVEVGPQQFKLTEVALGPAIGTMRPVLGGVAEGTKVVTEGAFHLNNERKRKELE